MFYLYAGQNYLYLSPVGTIDFNFGPLVVHLAPYLFTILILFLFIMTDCNLFFGYHVYSHFHTRQFKEPHGLVSYHQDLLIFSHYMISAWFANTCLSLEINSLSGFCFSSCLIHFTNFWARKVGHITSYYSRKLIYLTNFWVRKVDHITSYCSRKLRYLTSLLFPRTPSFINDTDELEIPTHARPSSINSILLERLHALSAATVHRSCVTFDSDAVTICVDTGASSTATMSKSDFVPGTYKPVTGITINGIASGLAMEGYDTIRWLIDNDNGKVIEVELDRVLHILKLPTRLLSPQQMARQLGQKGNGFYACASKGTLFFGDFHRTVQYDSSNGRPIFTTHAGSQQFSPFEAELVLDGGPRDNLSYRQRLILKWHHRLGHTNFRAIQRFARAGLLPKEIGTLRECDFPKCIGCQFGKQHHNSANKQSTGRPITSDDLQP